MFCPNCGKDCGEFKFCPHCGSKLADAAVQPRTWSVGMPCPHCGGTKLEGNNCAFCGAQLKDDIILTRNAPHNISTGIYLGLYDGTYFKILPDSLAIKNRHTQEFVIAYDQLGSVAYVKPSFTSGYFSVRGKTDSSIPFPNSIADAMKDQTTFIYQRSDRSFFLRLYYSLNDIIKENKH